MSDFWKPHRIPQKWTHTRRTEMTPHLVEKAHLGQKLRSDVESKDLRGEGDDAPDISETNVAQKFLLGPHVPV